ncbi:hypothetical protein JYG36_15100 [Pseudomonas sp. SORT22]|uniref:hypothetical protein n=1 Tax=Pseudomonas sp. SORT22 TaxID=2813842 RepID=UPI001BD14CA9|nr:hypothetical protein [Pseudomonas sp. SORT22]QVM94450.1 hypothetical protein JYG36_15100 [Pseudomonas sp. SORT22]
MSAEDALVHALVYLRCASSTIAEAVQYSSEAGKGLVWSTQHSVEMAVALIDAVLDGVESTAMNKC